MDSSRFDALTRSLHRHDSSRRALLCAVAGGLAAAGLASVPIADAARRKKKKCKNGTTRCGKKCVDLSSSAKNCGTCKNSCPFAIACVASTCVLRSVGEACDIDSQCLTGQCSLTDPQTCRIGNCKVVGTCASEAECCDGICFGGCCNGVCA